MTKRSLQIILFSLFGLFLIVIPGCDIFDSIIQDIINQALKDFYASLNPLNSPAGTSAVAGVAAAAVSGITAALLAAQSSIEGAIGALGGSSDTATAIADKSNETKSEEPDSSTETTGPSIYNPLTSELLPVNEQGYVEYGGELLTPQEALDKIKIDTDYLAAREHGQKLVDDYKATLSQLQEGSPEIKAQIDKLNGIRERMDAATDDATKRTLQQEFVDESAELRKNIGALKNSDDPAVRELSQKLEAQSAEMNADYASKNILKEEGRTGTGAFFDGNVHEIYSNVDQSFVDKLNAMGFRRGGREFTVDDLKEYRNSASRGTVGMDRDYGLNEEKIRKLIDDLDNARPGSDEAHEIVKELAGERARVKITVDPQVQVDYLRGEAEAVNTELDRLKADLDKLPSGSLEAERTQAEIDRLSERPEQLNREIREIETRASLIKESYISKLQNQLEQAAPGSAEAQRLTKEIGEAQTRLAGKNEIKISPGQWNESAQSTYNREYSNITRTDPEKAFQTVTTKGSTEAYADLPVLKGDPASQKYAEQTASVSAVKEVINNNLANSDKILSGEAIQETARGYSKDIATKIISQMSNDPNVDPAKLELVRKIQATFDDIGTGHVLPGQADGALQRAIPEIEGINMKEATRILNANYESSIKYQNTGSTEITGPHSGSSVETVKPSGNIETESGRPGAGAEAPSRAQQVFDRVNQLANIEARTNQNMAEGMTAGEALTVATAQTAAGAAEQVVGLANPHLTMAAGAILPNGINNVIPDQAIQNWVGTGYLGNKAILDSVRDSIHSGSLDTTALDKFGDVIANREGADPFKGIGQAVDLGTEEIYRTDGGNIISDLQKINETGAGVDTVNESMEEFQTSIAAAPPGNRNVILQGWDHLSRSASEVAVDPVYEAQSLYHDVKNMVNYGVGDGYWTECANNTAAVIKDTPVVGQVVKGYGEIYDGVAKQGVVGFSQEMYEGGTALAGEAVETVANSASDAYKYIKSFF